MERRAGKRVLFVALVCTFLKRNVLLKDHLSIAIFCGAVFLMEGFIHLSFGRYLNQIRDPYSGMMGFLVLNSILNAFFAPIMFIFLRWMDLWTGGIEIRNRSKLLYDL